MKEPLKAESLGFTGTRRGMSPAQKCSLQEYLIKHRATMRWFHHGDCQGADAEAVSIARELGYLIACHPPAEDRYRAFVRADYAYPENQFLQRNQEIVRCSATLIAAPRRSEEELRSGTWMTVRYARRISKPVLVLAPRGE